MYERLLNLLNAVGAPKVLLIGDFMLDNYLYGNTDRISPEAPVPVLNVTERHERPGGAGSVAVDLAALGAQVACLGIVGNDIPGRLLRHLLTQLDRSHTDALITVDDRPTTTKQRIIGLAQHRHRQQLMRIDEEFTCPINLDIQQKLAQHLEKLVPWCDVVCLQDYNKGVLSPPFCQKVIIITNQNNKRIIVDPASINDYSRYAGAWMIKPNRRELSLATGIEIDNDETTWSRAAEKLALECNIDNIVVTLDKQGAFLYSRQTDKSSPSRGELIPTRPRNVYDVTGAGDMVLAALGLLAGGNFFGIKPPALSEMVYLANVAGGLEVERFGCVGISRNEIAMEISPELRMRTAKIRTLDGLSHELPMLRNEQLKVVFTNGCFDILHPGHIHLLTFAKQQGDILIVAINSDNSVRALKGPQRPILKQQERAILLSALEAVDYVIIFDEPDPQRLIQAITPDVLVKGADWTGNVVGQDWVESHGGRIALMPLTQGFSTTSIIDKVIEQNHNPSTTDKIK